MHRPVQQAEQAQMLQAMQVELGRTDTGPIRRVGQRVGADPLVAHLGPASHRGEVR